LHVIPTLTGGGAENFVAALLPLLDDGVVQPAVMTIYPTALPADSRALTAVPLMRIDRKGRYDPGFFPRMVSAMRALRPDVVHTHMHNGKYWGRLAAIAAGVPVVVHTAHNPCDDHRLVAEVLADRALNARTSAIVTFLEHQRRFLAHFERIPEEKIVVIANGVPLGDVATPAQRAVARSRLRLNDDTFAIFVIGRLQEIKNQQLALRAMYELPFSLRRKLALYIIGNGPDRARLARTIEELGLDECVSMLGHRSDVKEILPAADLVFAPSRSEGMPLALIEAMAAGIPVLSAPWLGATEFLDGGRLGTIAADYDPLHVASLLAQLANAREFLGMRARAAAQEVRERYDIQLTAARHRDLYRRLVDRASAA